ncbi:MAG: hypothetical protein ACFCGT_13355 [Sandaracinaceae bacterium]
MTSSSSGLSLPLAVVLAGCTALPIEVGVPIEEQRVEGSPVPGDLPLDIPIPLDIDLEAETEARGTGPARRVQLQNLVLRVTDTAEPAGDRDDFGFITRVEVFVEPVDAGSPLARERVAVSGEPSDEGRELPFDEDRGINLRPYIEAGARLTTSATGTVPPDDVTLDGHVTLGLAVF